MKLFKFSFLFLLAIFNNQFATICSCKTSKEELAEQMGKGIKEFLNGENQRKIKIAKLLPESRIKTFIDMAEDGGNMQAFDAIEFDEFVAFQSMYGRKKLTNILIDKLAEKQLKNGQIEGMGKIGENARKEAVKILNKFADAKERLEEKIYG